MEPTLWVRLAPRDPARGAVLHSYTYAGIKFSCERGWYKVTKAVGDYLRTVRQVASEPHSALAFTVCSEKEAQVLDKKEAEAKEREKATRAIDTTVEP